jgi:hypothetical protein
VIARAIRLKGVVSPRKHRSVIQFGSLLIDPFEVKWLAVRSDEVQDQEFTEGWRGVGS